jgi:stage V sporulation protein S
MVHTFYNRVKRDPASRKASTVIPYGNRFFEAIKELSAVMKILKVSANSVPNSVAGAIANVIKEESEAEVQAVGAGAINQAVKAIAVSRGFLAQVGTDIYCQPAFVSLIIDNTERTGIKFIIKVLNG